MYYWVWRISLYREYAIKAPIPEKVSLTEGTKLYLAVEMYVATRSIEWKTQDVIFLLSSE